MGGLRIGLWIIIAIASSMGMAGRTHASQHCSEPIARIVSLIGAVEFQPASERRWKSVQLNLLICPGDGIRTGEESRVAIVFPATETILRIDQNTTFKILSPRADDRSLLEIIKGALYFFSRTPRALGVRTPFVNAGIEGTEFSVGVTERSASIIVFEGRVRASNDQGSVLLTDNQRNQRAVASAGQAPHISAIARPRDSVQWTLFYPPVFTDPANPAHSALSRRVSRLLAAGRAKEASRILKGAKPQSADILALRAVIAVVLDDRKEALDLGHRAVQASPDSASARIALSYAHQASFDLEGARDTLETATKRKPGDALAWARLAELWLSLGYLDRALHAAKKAASLAPRLSRTNTVLGFAYLTEIRIQKARKAFLDAVSLDSQDPLPRLGLGLAKIRDGDLAGGRRDLEIAAALDPGSSIIRSYLGKAYFEEKRAPLDSHQFTIAKKLDPKDPTPWLYDAIRKQTENRPVEALRDLQKSIELNDNRAVYRSRLLLDEDRAARGASLARIYNQLAFHQLGINEATRSLTSDPTSASAHRFLSDTYRGVRRREIARVSELLQAQLLQDININPIQPSISGTNLNIITRGGPAGAGFNEFTPLFERNEVRLDTTGSIGNEGTFEGEAVVSGVHDRFSVSGGAFHGETNGFRTNNGIDQEVYNFYAQAALSPRLNVQAEFRRLDSTEGDLGFNFDPDDFSPNFERTLDHDIARIGVRYSPTPNSDFLVSFILSDREETIRDREFAFFIFDRVQVESVDDKGYQFETQYLYRQHRFNVTAGLAYSDVDRTKDELIAFVPGGPSFADSSKSDIIHPRGYFYVNMNGPKAIIWTLGLGYDDYDQEALKVRRISPKFGIQWKITDNLRLRGAAFQTIKPALVSNRTLEPTQISGFNQFFDDVNATKSWRYGIGLDWRVENNLAVGAEASWRDLDTPFFAGSDVVFEDQREEYHRAYVYWTPLDKVALRAEFVYERLETQVGNLTDSQGFPKKLVTKSVPVSARYFHPSGFFAGASATFVDQEVRRSAAASGAEGSDQFVVVDAAIGWRLPKRLGIASLEIRNIFNEKFSFQDDSFREHQDAPAIGPYIPDRMILGRITLNF